MTPFSLRFATIGFDLDGTLVDSSGDIAASVNHALATIGRSPLSVAAVRSMIGGGGRLMLQRALLATGGDAPLDDVLPIQTAYYDAHIAERTRAYPGAVAALDALAAHGATLAVVTNKRESAAKLLLAALGLADRFACVIGGDTLGPGHAKPSPAPIRAMIERCGGPAAFVGDSAFDVQAARAAGIPVVACRFGFVGDGVDDLGADAVIDDYAGLLPALAGLSPKG